MVKKYQKTGFFSFWNTKKNQRGKFVYHFLALEMLVANLQVKKHRPPPENGTYNVYINTDSKKKIYIKKIERDKFFF